MVEPGKAGEPVLECPHERHLALDLDIAGESVNEDEVAWSLAGDRVRDRHVPAPRILDLVSVGHRLSLGRIRAGRKHPPNGRPESELI
jgi:hypothetical protein